MANLKNGRGPIGSLAVPPADWLICFAVKEEAKFCLPSSSVQFWLTGMGRKNAVESIREAIARVQPQRVITAGFAGGLNPDLANGAVIYDQDFDAGLGDDLQKLGGLPAKFYCHSRVAVTAAEKEELWKKTGADAVEMESSVIRTICREFKIPSATVRVISDAADQDLPLDFNALMTSDDRINFARLGWQVLSHPGRISKLLEFQRQTIMASRRLGECLTELLRVKRC
jgi:adenosylhomocysteine nucleosidase